jgi:hypothetical protein
MVTVDPIAMQKRLHQETDLTLIDPALKQAPDERGEWRDPQLGFSIAAELLVMSSWCHEQRGHFQLTPNSRSEKYCRRDLAFLFRHLSSPWSGY